MRKRDKGIILAILILFPIIIGMGVLLLIQMDQYQKHTPVSANGSLAVEGQRIVNEDGYNFDLKGISTMNIGWQPEYVNRDAFLTARDKWGVNTIRLPIPTSGSHGYCRKENREVILETLELGIDLAEELGMYVIVDWHTLNEKDPNIYREYAIEVLDYISQKYQDARHIIYEICNEPNGSRVRWKKIKAYAEQVIPVIREHDPNAIIIVGTPDFCTNLEGPIKDPIIGVDNLMYSYHFYAGSSMIRRREEFQSWAETGLPILVSEFSVSETDSDGTDAPAFVSANHWMKLLDDYGIGKVYFSLSAEEQTNAMLRADCDKRGSWSREDLSESGCWVVDYYKDYTGRYKDTLGVTELSTSASEVDGVTADLALESYGSEELGYSSFYKIKIKNDSKNDVENWRLKIVFDDIIEMKDSWNGSYLIEQNQLEITPAEWNHKVEMGEEIEIGFIVTGRDLSCVLEMQLQIESGN